MAQRIARVSAGVEFITVEEAVIVIIDADAPAGTGRHAGIGNLAKGPLDLPVQGPVRQRRIPPPVAEELARPVEEATPGRSPAARPPAPAGRRWHRWRRRPCRAAPASPARPTRGRAGPPSARRRSGR